VGDSPVRGKGKRTNRHLSKTVHVEDGLNLRGPSRKAKYSLATDSEPSSASERWEEPLQREDTEPETTCLQAIGARLMRGETEGRGAREPMGFLVPRPSVSPLMWGDGVPFA
jgi:hypothetical protein